MCIQKKLLKVFITILKYQMSLKTLLNWFFIKFFYKYLIQYNLQTMQIYHIKTHEHFIYSESMVKIWKLTIPLPHSTSCRIKHCFIETQNPSDRIKNKNIILSLNKELMQRPGTCILVSLLSLEQNSIRSINFTILLI